MTSRNVLQSLSHEHFDNNRYCLVFGKRIHCGVIYSLIAGLLLFGYIGGSIYALTKSRTHSEIDDEDSFANKQKSFGHLLSLQIEYLCDPH